MSKNQNQLYIYIAATLVVGLIIGYFGAGLLGGGNTDALQQEINDLEAQVTTLQAQIDELTEQSVLKGNLIISGSSTVFPIADLAAEDFQDIHSQVNIQVEGPGSGTGIAKATDNTADIGMSSRDLKASELLKAPRLIIVGVAKDSVSIVVNPDNPLAATLDLTIQQVKDIFTGKITNWEELGGPDHKITVYTREEGSGTRATFMELVGIKEGEFPADASVQQGNSAMRASVANNEYGIAYISLGYVDETVSPAKVNGADGTVENVLKGTYPFQRVLWMFTNGMPSKLEQAYLDYVLSPAGQKIVQESGFIPIYPTN